MDLEQHRENLKQIKEEKVKFEEKGMGVDFRDGITYVDIERERDIYEKDQKRIDKKFNSKRFPNFRLTAEYLMRKYLDREFILDKKIICKELNIGMYTLNFFLSDLNRYEKFQPMRWISVQGKKDMIEVAGVDFRNSHKWIKRNMKGSISRTARVYQTKEKVKLAEEIKALKERKKIKVKVKNES